ncbi:JAB domain-containing protein [Candidatus Poribacteria bacterium]|nr:JAB domain-containing protein [Candidatus Poribacteria bacterium]
MSNEYRPRIKDLPKDERPRERLHKYGAESLKDSELLAIILKNGFQGTTAVQLGEQILIALDGDLKRMADYKSKQFEKIKGVGEAKAAQIVAALELGKRLARFHAERDKITSPSDVADLMMSKMRYLQKEIVCVLCLDTKGGVTTKGVAGDLSDDLAWGKKLSEATVFEGTLNASVFHPREIFRFAIEESANSIVLVHNHPSGDPQPSQEDIRATKQLIEAGNQIGIKVLDHVIVGDGIFVSLKEEGFI